MPPEKKDEVLRTLPGPEQMSLWRKFRDRLIGSTDWVNLLATANGAIQASLLTTRGDMIRRSATGPERFAKGAQNTILAAGANDPDWVTVSAAIDNAIGSTRGSLLHRGASAWGLLTPGTSGHFLKSNGAGADLSFAAVSQPAWVQIGTDRTVDGVEDFTDLGGYQTIWLQLDAVTISLSGLISARVSADNGSTFLSSSGDYKIFTDVGSATDLDVFRLTSTNLTTARYASAIIYGWNLTKPKMVHHMGSAIHYINTSSALNALRVLSSAGTPNGGTIRIFGIPA